MSEKSFIVVGILALKTYLYKHLKTVGIKAKLCLNCLKIAETRTEDISWTSLDFGNWTGGISLFL